MKRYTLVLFLFLCAGCGFFPRSNTPVQQHTTAQITNTTERLEQIGALAVGVDATIPTKPDVAADLNKKVMTLAEEPSPEQIKAVMDSITNTEAKEELEKRITDLIEEKRKVAQESNHLINNLSNQNSALAAAKDKAEADLNDLRQPTTAIWYGITTIFKRFMWTMIIGGVIFLLLRTFAGSHPAIGAVFSIFEHIVAFIIKGVAALFPRMLAFAGNVSAKEYNRKSQVLDKIVLSIESLKERGDTNITIDDLLDELSKRMDDDEKKTIAEIKLSLK